MPRALIAAVVVTGVYVLVALAALGTQPWQDFAQSRKPPSSWTTLRMALSEPNTVSAGAEVVTPFHRLVTMYSGAGSCSRWGATRLPARFAR